jgi:hypothetical protein
MCLPCVVGGHSLAAATGVVWGTPNYRCTLVVPMANEVWGTLGGR